MNPENPLTGLKDIHLPDAISPWPPAPGWWLLAILILIFTIWLGRKILRHHQHKLLMRLSLKQLDQFDHDFVNHQNQQKLIQQYSTLLRRVALAKFKRQDVASLTGDAWLEFLQSVTAEDVFCKETGQLLIDAAYRRPNSIEDKLTELQSAVRQWITIVTRSKEMNPNASVRNPE